MMTESSAKSAFDTLSLLVFSPIVIKQSGKRNMLTIDFAELVDENKGDY
jgi:hypothetical protein